jgi:hypothetical protein
MSTSFDTSGYDTTAFDRGVNAVLRLFSVDQAQRVVQYQGDEVLRREIDQLAAKSDEGTLTPAERARYEGYVRANKFVAVLQTQARKFLASQQPG